MTQDIDNARIECACGVGLRLPAHLLGRKVKCPKCGTLLQTELPVAVEAVEEAGDCAVCGRLCAVRVRKGIPRCQYCGAAEGNTGQVPRAQTKPREWDAPWLKDNTASLARFRYLAHEAHIRAVAIWSIAGGVIVTLLLVWLLLSADASILRRGPVTGFIGIGILLSGLSVFVGIGLYAYQAWAQMTYALLTGIGVLMSLASLTVAEGAQISGAMLQIGFSCACLWVVLGGPAARIFTEEYRQKVEQTERTTYVPTYSSPFFWIPLLLIGLAFACVIALGAMR